jgi:F0F1-type ATP synthase assembly protein I
VDQKKTDPARYAFNLTLAAVAGQVGCLTVLIIFLALLAGLWLDNRFGTPRPFFTIGLLLASVPVTLIAMVLVVRQTTSRIQMEKPQNKEDAEEEHHGN